MTAQASKCERQGWIAIWSAHSEILMAGRVVFNKRCLKEDGTEVVKLSRTGRKCVNISALCALILFKN
jgi:hypothetical protein